jgi:hypothetical protein
MASFDRSRAALALPGTAAETRLSGPRVGLAYEYVGHTALTVVGAASGQRYRFTPGSVQALDPRDRAALSAIPLLRRR